MPEAAGSAGNGTGQTDSFLSRKNTFSRSSSPSPGPVLHFHLFAAACHLPHSMNTYKIVIISGTNNNSAGLAITCPNHVNIPNLRIFS